MAEVTNALIYRTLMEIQEQLASIDEMMDDCRCETRATLTHLDRANADLRNIHRVLMRNDDHLTRIERRLGIVEARL